MELIKLPVEKGQDVNAADNYGITPLIVAANLGDLEIVKYLVSKGADLSAHGSSVEPLMPIDYATSITMFSST